jgi:hypothetical protein
VDDTTGPKESGERRAVPLTPEQLSEMLKVMKGADSVELKLSVPDADTRSTVAALDMDPLDAEIRQVAFFDTPDLTLNAHGIVVRARRVKAKPGDSVVKLRPIVPDEVDPTLRQSPSFGIEVDAMPGGFVCSGTMKAPMDGLEVREAFRGERPIRKLFTKEQRALFDAHKPEGVELDDLVVLGPVNVFKLKFTPKEFHRRLVAELWLYPDNSRILELSTKCTPNDAFTAAAETRAFLGTHGVDLFAEQQTKTRTALEYFARELARKGA